MYWNSQIRHKTEKASANGVGLFVFSAYLLATGKNYGMFCHHCSKTMLFFICIAITLKRISFFQIREREKRSHLQNSWNQTFCSLNIKLRSRSLRVVVDSIWDSGFSVTRPWEEPFKSKRLWMAYSVQNKFPIMTKRTCSTVVIKDKLDETKAWTCQILYWKSLLYLSHIPFSEQVHSTSHNEGQKI